MLSPPGAVFGQAPAGRLSMVCLRRTGAAERTGFRGDRVFMSARRMQSIGWHAAGLLALVAVFAGSGSGEVVAIVRRAAAIPDKAEGLEGFVNASNALVGPALVAMAAVAPLGCVVGAGALMFGSRRGMVIIGASLGTLIFLGSVKGIVA
jgi:hypothetical protein